MKKLLIARHAKSSLSFDQRDFDRPLNLDGKSDAKMMAAKLIEKQFMPDHIISSGANRALTTSQIISKEIKYDLNNIEVNNDIYHSSVDTTIEIIKTISNEYDSVIIAGHNPTFHYLSQILSNETINKFPSCTMFCVLFKIDDWLEVENGEKIFMIYPSMYK